MMPALRRAQQILVSVMLSVGAVQVRAEELYIVSLDHELDGEVVREARASVARQIATHTVLDVAPPESLPAELTQAELRSCAGDAECFVHKVGRSFDHLLVISMRQFSGQVLVGLRWIDLTSGTVVERGVDARTLARPELIVDELPAMLAAVFGQRWDDVGGLVVEVDVPSAEIAVGGSVCLTPCRKARLRPGPHAVEVRAEGYIDQHLEVMVRRGATTRSTVAMVSLSSDTWSPWLWAGIGGVVVGATVAVIAVVATSAPTQLCLRDAAAACPP